MSKHNYSSNKSGKKIKVQKMKMTPHMIPHKMMKMPKGMMPKKMTD